MALYSGVTDGIPLTENEIYPTLNYLFNGDASTFSSTQLKTSIPLNNVTAKLRGKSKHSLLTTKDKETAFCYDGGKVTAETNIDQQTGVGKVTYTFDQCDNGNAVISGKQIFDYLRWASNVQPADYNVIYENYVEQSNQSYIKLVGNIEFKNADSCEQTTTTNLLYQRDQISVLEKDLKTESVTCELVYSELKIGGRIYFSDVGYVDISTATPIVLDNNKQLLSGNLHIFNEKSSIVINTVNSNSSVSVDRDNDSTIDFTATTESWNFTAQPYKRNLLVPDSGVALSKFVTVEKLSHDIDILDSYHLTTTNWLATTTSPWLTVTPTGTTAEKLTISADASGLAADTLYTATIVVNSNDPGIENSQTVNVGFWVGSSDPLTRIGK